MGNNTRKTRPIAKKREPMIFFRNAGNRHLFRKAVRPSRKFLTAKPVKIASGNTKSTENLSVLRDMKSSGMLKSTKKKYRRSS